MFVIKKISTGELGVWLNKRTEDFARYLPRNLSTTKEDLEIYLCCDGVCKRFDEDDYVYLAEEVNGEVVLRVYKDSAEDENGDMVYTNLLHTHSSQLIDWPYDDVGDFIVPDVFTPDE